MGQSFAGLLTTLSSSLKGGQIGEPVSLRCRLVAPPEMISSAINSLMQTVGGCFPGFGEDGGRFRIQPHPSGRQTNVLLLSARGPSVSLTWVPDEGERASVKLLVVGNHGVLRLEDDLKNSWTSGITESSEIDWYERFQAALDQDQPVSFS